MLGAQGSNVAEVQAQYQKQQEAAGERSGFGLGHSDSVSTIVDGAGWWFSLLEKVIGAYPNIVESLSNGSSLVTLFGKSANMLGIKFLEGIAEYFSGGGGDGEGVSSEGPTPGDYPHTDDGMAHSAAGLRDDTHYEGDHPPGGPVSPGFSPSVGDDHHPDYRPELGG